MEYSPSLLFAKFGQAHTKKHLADSPAFNLIIIFGYHSSSFGIAKCDYPKLSISKGHRTVYSFLWLIHSRLGPKRLLGSGMLYAVAKFKRAHDFKNRLPVQYTLFP
jgi:hypothetical protein